MSPLSSPRLYTPSSPTAPGTTAARGTPGTARRDIVLRGLKTITEASPGLQAAKAIAARLMDHTA